ncbi:MAG: transporter substrate-binding domain-containing protein [Marinobacter sp.]|nr:transporter substrate-binding domain-containing protein [Marinobacter sp.]
MCVCRWFTLWLLAGTAWAADEVVLAVEDDWAPYAAVLAPGQEPEGFAVDIVRAAFNSQGITVRLLAVPFNRCMFMAATGRVDGCFNATITTGNLEVYHWHQTPMFREALAIFGLAEAPHDGVTLADLSGKRVAYTLGYTYPTELMQREDVTFHGVQSDELLIRMLVAGRVDYILLNEMPGYLRLLDMPDAQGRVHKVGTISMDGFWIAFSREDSERSQSLAERFERGLAELKDSGRYASMERDFRARFNL